MTVLLLVILALTVVFTVALTRMRVHTIWPGMIGLPGFGGIELIVSRNVPPGTIYLFPKGAFHFDPDPPLSFRFEEPRLPILMEQRISLSVARPDALAVITSI